MDQGQDTGVEVQWRNHVEIKESMQNTYTLPVDK